MEAGILQLQGQAGFIPQVVLVQPFWSVLTDQPDWQKVATSDDFPPPFFFFGL